MTKNILLMLAGLLAIVIGFVAFKPTTTPTAPQTKKFAFVVTDKKLTSFPDKIQVTEGDQVELTLTANKDWPLFHLHGFELKTKVVANVPATLSFKADKTGRFKIELHFVENKMPEKEESDAKEEEKPGTASDEEMTLGFLEVQPK
jgi:hypothetical protein